MFTYQRSESDENMRVDCWKLCLYGTAVLGSMCLHFFLAIFSGLLTTGIVLEWTIYFAISCVILLWTWINHIVSIRVVCNSSLIPGIRKYMIISYCVQLGMHALMALAIVGFYTSHPDARGLWTAVVYAGGFNWLLLGIVFLIFYFLLEPPNQKSIHGYAYVPVQQIAPMTIRQDAYHY